VTGTSLLWVSERTCLVEVYSRGGPEQALGFYVD